MGAWSHEAFGNDDACDWLAQLEQSDDFSAIESAFDTILTVDDDFYIEAPEACEAIAAAEVVARLQGNVGTEDGSSEQVDAWIERVRSTPSSNLAGRAIRVLDRILTEPSELLDLSNEVEASTAWLASINELKMRLAAQP